MKNYAVTLSFLEPVEGVAYVSGNTPEEAEAKARELFQNRQNVTIVDIIETDEEVEFFDIPGFFNGEEN